MEALPQAMASLNVRHAWLAGAVVIALTVPGQAAARDVWPWIEDLLTRLLPWIESQGLLGLLLYGLLDALLVILLVPVLALALGAGLLFGIVKGTLLMVCATTVGAVGAFLIGRHALGPPARRWLHRRPPARVLASVVRDGGWPTIALLRLIPFFPFKTTNYLFGAMEFRLPAFIIGTAAGILPLTATVVSIGAMAGDVSAALSMRDTRTAAEWVLLAGGLLVALILCLVLGHRARRRLAALSPDTVDERDASCSRE